MDMMTNNFFLNLFFKSTSAMLPTAKLNGSLPPIPSKDHQFCFVYIKVVKYVDLSGRNMYFNVLYLNSIYLSG